MGENLALNQIFNQYIEMFPTINDSEHMEYYKWQICAKFRKMMDDALASDKDTFAKALMDVKKLTENIIDSFTQPFYGMVKFAEEEPETVRDMFIELFKPDHDDLELRMKKIDAFFKKSDELLDKYYKGSYLYKQDSHAVSAYLFLYDPDHHFLYKATECNKIAECIGFYDSWGSGNNIKLDVFYRMCNNILAEIKNCPELLNTDASRYDDRLKLQPGELHKDPEKHILLFDIIYCSHTYSVYDHVTYEKRNAKEKKLYLENQKKAQELNQVYEEAKTKKDMLDEAIDYFSNVIKPGDEIKHKKFGVGTVVSVNGTYLVADFPKIGETKELNLCMVIANGIVKYTNVSDFDEKVNQYKDVLGKAQSISMMLGYAAKDLELYREYI